MGRKYEGQGQGQRLRQPLAPRACEVRVEVAVAPDDLDRAPLHESRVASGGVRAL